MTKIILSGTMVPMGVVTSQQLTAYYDKYRDSEIMFSREVAGNLNLVPKQVYIKCEGDQWPCIINSTSLQNVRIIIGTKGGAFQKISRKECPPVSVRFCFAPPESDIISFFVTCHVADISSFNGKNELAIINLHFSQRPPDALIEMVGRIQETKMNFERRKDERILINVESQRKLQLNVPSVLLYVQNVPRKCVLRDISFSGARLIIMGIAKFLDKKEAYLRLAFYDPTEVCDLPGKIIRVEPIEGRKELVIISLKFEDVRTSLAYKLRINSYLTSLRKRDRGRVAKKGPVKPTKTTSSSLSDTPVKAVSPATEDDQNTIKD